MSTSLFTLEIRHKRDIVLARQRARQVAGLLGFESRDQVFIAAAVFEIARKAGAGKLTFQLDAESLKVFAVPSGPFRLEKSLPRKAQVMSADDLEWAIHNLDKLTPLDLWWEIQQQNRELLGLIQELHARETELAAEVADSSRSAA